MAISEQELQPLISKGLQDFYKRRMDALGELRLKKFLSRKNPYLFRAVGVQKAAEIVEQALLAHIQASDETMFGDAFFEPIARIVSGGKTSDAEGVDFVIESDERIMVVAVKSGPYPFNASQKKRQSQEFLAVRSRLHKLHKQFDALLAHAYGRTKSQPSKDKIYRDSSGQTFWTEITGDPDFYLKLIGLMRNEPAKHRKTFAPAWDAAVNRFTGEFIQEFCFPDGRIDWEKLTKFVSEEKTPKTKANPDK